MKKVFVLLSMVLLIQTSFAQVNKGQWLVGGSTTFTSTSQGDYSNTNFDFSPNVGYFFMNNFAGGLRLGFMSDKDKGDDATSSFNIAPFLRYYFLPAEKKVNVFGDASYGFGSYNSGGGEGDSKMNSSNFSIAAGPAIFLTPHTALEFALSYNSMKFEDVADRYNTIGFNVGFQIHLGKAKK
jgi:hypothetical protein